MAQLLAFDTSTESMSISLQWSQGLLVREAIGGAQASSRLIPDILALLAEAGCALSDLDAVAFGRGPGAFTGLRTSCSVAQGLAFGAEKPVLPIDSLMLVAQDALAQSRDDAPGEAGFEVWVAMDARMNEVYAGAYRWQGSRWSVLSEPALYAPEALQSLWHDSPPRTVAGSALMAFAERLDTGAARRFEHTRSRAHALAHLAEQMWQQGAAVEAALALPVYLRDKVAQTTIEREATRLAREQPA